MHIVHDEFMRIPDLGSILGAQGTDFGVNMSESALRGPVLVYSLCQWENFKRNGVACFVLLKSLEFELFLPWRLENRV